MEEPRGYRAPIHTSLIRPMLMMGVPRDLFILNATFGFAFVMMKVYPLIVINIVLHMVAVQLTKRDAWFFKALLRHIKDNKYFEA